MHSHNGAIDTTHTPPPLSFYNTFKGLSQDGGRTDFSKNLRTSLFNIIPIEWAQQFQPDLSRWTVSYTKITLSI